ncbi:MAG: hypothetical protein Ct9H90mP13_13260 [Pseudomonadota bacterium]|nr:MAG: hypothetical protein Ct9H90mP13_13260 [Pseudomonadota bacterium]
MWGHAGDQESIGNMIEHCTRHNVLFGPHPSYPDKKGLGVRDYRSAMKH